MDNGYFIKGKDSFNAGDYKLAMEYLQAAIEYDHTTPEAHLLLADCYLAMGKEKNAQSTLHQLLAIDPSNKKALNKLQKISEASTRTQTTATASRPTPKQPQFQKITTTPTATTTNTRPHVNPPATAKGNRTANTTWIILLASTLFLIAIIVLVSHLSSDAYKMKTFNRVIEETETAEITEKDCIWGFSFGMSRKDYDNRIEEMEREGLITWDTFHHHVYTLYTVTLEPGNDKTLYLEPDFYRGELCALHINAYTGGDSKIKDEIRQSGRLSGFTHYRVPAITDIPYKNGERILPRYKKNVIEIEEPYDFGDELYIKDNMMIVFGGLSITYYNMPAAKNRF